VNLQGRRGLCFFVAVLIQCAIVSCTPRDASPDQHVVDQIPFADAAEDDPPLCHLKSAEALTGPVIDMLRTTAEADLRKRKPGMSFEFERAIAGPVPGHASLIFANLTYLDQFYVYVGQLDSARLIRVSRTGGVYYSEAKCQYPASRNPAGDPGGDRPDY
jgi:hypothetical protein